MPVSNKYKSAAEWEKLGVLVQHAEGDLPRAERETTLAFLDTSRLAEVNTCRRDWMKRLESCGAIPKSIQVYAIGDGEFRWYEVPKSWIKKPYKSHLSTKENK